MVRFGGLEEQEGEAGTREALERVEGEDEVAWALAEHALDVGGAGVAGAFLQDVDAVALGHKHSEVDGTQKVSD